jgi:hypothetical protein
MQEDERDRLEIAKFDRFEGTVGIRLRYMIQRLEEERKRESQQLSLEAVLVDLLKTEGVILRLPHEPNADRESSPARIRR